MRILLVNPPWQRFFMGSVSNHPISLAYIASYFRCNSPENIIEIYNADYSYRVNFIFNFCTYAKGHEIYIKKLYDFSNMIWKEVRETIKAYNPDIVGISSMTASYVSALNVAKIVKNINPKIKVVMGGRHPSALPEIVIKNEEVDYVVIGEGEKTFLELISNLDSPQKVEGVVYKNAKGDIFFTEKREFIDINSLPLPIFESKITKYYYESVAENYDPVHAWGIVGARGCPFNCIYCASENVVRYRSPQNIINEIREVKKRYKINEVSFEDDSFSLNRKRTIELCNALQTENISWRCNTRVDLIDEELIKKMKLCGCNYVNIGIESGSPNTLAKIQKNITYDKVYDAITMLKKNGLPVMGYFMIGFPWETENDMYLTVNLIKRLPLNNHQVNIATPLPGTQLFQSLVDTGQININTENWDRYQQGSVLMNFSSYPDDYWSKLLLKYLRISEKIYWYRKIKELFKQLINNPVYIIRKIYFRITRH